MSSLFRRAAVIVAALSGLFLATPALGILVRPVVIDLTSAGSGASSSLEVVNDRNRPMAVEVKVQKLILGERGQPVVQPDSGDDFVIFPTIANIAPGARQVFRIRYIGNPSIAQSKLYMFSTAELPVPLDPNEKQAQLQIVYAINSIVTVKPPKAKPDVRVAEVDRKTSSKGVQGVDVVFQNDGPAHAYIGTDTLQLSSGSWHVTLDAGAFGKAVGLGLVPPNAKRAMFIPLANVPPSGPISGELKPAS